MMTSTAFAADLTQLKPGDQIVFTMSDFKDQNNVYVKDGAGASSSAIEPKAYEITTDSAKGWDEVTYYTNDLKKLGATWDTEKYGGASTANINASFGLKTQTQNADLEAAKKRIDMVARQDIENYDFTATNFAVTVNAPVGKNLIKNYEFDGAGNLIVNLKAEVARQDIENYDFTATNFAVTVNAPVGKNLIKNYEFDGAGNLIVNLKADYRLPSDSKPDLIISDVTVKSKRDIKKIGDNSTVALYKNRTFVAKTANGTNSATNTIGADTHFSVGVETMSETLNIGTEIDLNSYQSGEWIKFEAGDAYSGDVRFDGGNIQVKGKVYSGDVVNFQYNAAPTDAAIRVIQNNPVEANIIVHNIVAKNFKTGFTVSIPGSSLFGAEADANGDVEVLSLVAANNKKLYLLSNTGVLTAAPFVYNNTTGAWEGRLPAQGGTILISDVALKGVTAGTGTVTGTGNPSTGFGIDFSSAVVK